MHRNRSSNAASCVLGLAVAFFVSWTSAPSQAWGALCAGVAVVNITEDKPAVPVHDPLLVKALLLEDGGNRAVIISLDLIAADEALLEGVRRGVQQELGIDPGAILLNASHNHRTSGQIAKDLTSRIVKAVKQASEKMVPARIGAGSGHEQRITINRRLRMKDGTHWTIRRSTPSPADTDVAGLGPCDWQIGLLRVDTAEGKPLALVYNFAGHPYGGVPSGGVTADYPGFASRGLRRPGPAPSPCLSRGPGATSRRSASRI